MTNITIAGNNLPTFSSSTFSGLSLMQLNLTRNNILDLGLNPFGDSAIKILDLSYNKISTLLKSSFSSQLLDIRISWNRLSYIESECFNSDLQFLNLEYNSLYYINRNHFSNLRSLRELYLGNNRLTDVDLTDNNLSKLEKLDLSYNRIKNLHRLTFSSLSNLKYLNVTSNQIKWISSITVQILTNLKILDISLNYFTSFPYSSLSHSIESFNAFGNPWNCICFLHMEKYLVYNKVIFNCGTVSSHVPFCISYGGRCDNKANDTLVAAFTEIISSKLTPYCIGLTPPKGEIGPIYPMVRHRPFLAPIRKHQFK
ncbi:chaoptin-like [Anoplophora glabripennis]|uniref:chaoptin-like n=1 Tax=Anoplophora glabripennis TaxID=217634 RepID=UPI0008750579|nr:chaoptin-like [Anoplophora glabripennis]